MTFERHPSRTASRRTRSAASVALVVATLFAPLGAVAGACRADSGTTRAALVELYTSEGCSSCPPADQRLSKLQAGAAAAGGARIVPLALHVDYWDSIGWKDPFAQPAFTRRQAWEVQANRKRTSYTPHFFVNGKEVLDWRADLADNLRASTMVPAARIGLSAEPQGASQVRLKVDGKVDTAGRAHGPLQLFVVVTEGKLSSQVDAGENRGVRLDHEAVARNWIGPIAVQDGVATLDRVVDVPQLAGGHVGIAAFIQDATSAEVLQAVDTGTCRPT